MRSTGENPPAAAVTAIEEPSVATLSTVNFCPLISNVAPTSVGVSMTVSPPQAESASDAVSSNVAGISFNSAYI